MMGDIVLVEMIALVLAQMKLLDGLRLITDPAYFEKTHHSILIT